MCAWIGALLVMASVPVDLFGDVARQALVPPPSLTVSEWADSRRWMDPKMTSGLGGRWSTSTTPYARGIQDAAAMPGIVTTITVMKGTQIGGTEILYNIVGYKSDITPQNMLIVMPDEKNAKSVFRDRIVPMFKLSPELRKHMTGWKDDATGLHIILDLCNIYAAWANSPASLASRPLPFIGLDEVDKFPAFSGREASPTKLAYQRTITFWNRLVYQASTPTTRHGYIFGEYELSNKQRYFVPCPHCGIWDVLEFRNIHWGDDWDHERIRTLGLGYYECPHCERPISDVDKLRMISGGLWCPEGCSVDWACKRSKDGARGIVIGEVPETSHYGFHLPSQYSPWVTWSMMAGEFVEARGDRAKLMNFVNSWQAEIWEEKTAEIQADTVIELVSDYEPGIIPNWAQLVCAGSDVQLDRLYVTVRAWGPARRSRLILAANISGGTFDQLGEIVLNRGFRHEGGAQMMVRCLGLDRRYRTPEVDAFCRKWQGRVRGIMGIEENPQSVPYRALAVDKDARGTAIPGGLRYWSVDSSYYMDELAFLMEERDPVLWEIYAGVPGEYIEHLTSRVKVMDRRKGRPREIWKQKPGHPQDHFIDCEVYGLAIADMFHVQMLTVVQSGGWDVSSGSDDGDGWTIGRN